MASDCRPSPALQVALLLASRAARVLDNLDSVSDVNLFLALFLMANLYAVGYATGRARECGTCGHNRRTHQAPERTTQS